MKKYRIKPKYDAILALELFFWGINGHSKKIPLSQPFQLSLFDYNFKPNEQVGKFGTQIASNFNLNRKRSKQKRNRTEKRI